MERALFISVIVAFGLSTAFIGCNFHKATIYKTWTFSKSHPVNASKAMPMDNLT